MRRHNHPLAFALLLTTFAVDGLSAAGNALPQVAPDPVGLTKETVERTDALFQDYVTRKQIAGAVALVIHHGKVAYQGAFGKQDVEAGIPMSPDTIFRIASMTKPITSTAAMILVERGRIDLSDPISRYLPEFKFMKVAMPKPKDDAHKKAGDPGADVELVWAYRPITIRDLLTHTSGLCYRFRNRPLVGRLYVEAGICDGLTPSDHSLAENVRRLAALPLAHQPGTAWEYGLNTDVLGRLIEVVSGKSLDAFFTEEIFAPLKMHDTCFVLPESKRGRLAALYEHASDGTITRAGEGPNAKGPLIYAPSLPYQGTQGYFSGGAGLVSTTGDYARLLQMFLNHGELEGARILRPETVQTMTRDQIGGVVARNPRSWAPFRLWFRHQLRCACRRQEGSGGELRLGRHYYTDFWVDPEHQLIGIMMTQLDPSVHLTLRDEFHRLVNESRAK